MMPVFNAGTFWRELRAGRPRGPTEASVFERHRILQPEFLGATAMDTFEGMRKQIPAFANSVIRERYAGALMASLDNLGVISSVQRIPGLYLGTGMLYGLTMAAAAGEALADLITGERPKFDITPYRYERFADGSRFEFHA
jgi:glycine/D-amino acid oxidase-like deaminating enzyme